MIHEISWDIETVRWPKAEHWLKTKGIKPDSRLKDPEKIRASIEEKRAALFEKAALSPITGMIVCICAHHEVDQPVAFYGADERDILIRFFTWYEMYLGTLVLTGKYSQHFDLPFVVMRAMVHDIGVPYRMQDQILGRRPLQEIEQVIGDASLDDVAFAFGIEGKTAHGSEVQEMWDRYLLGEKDQLTKLVHYCSRDAELVHVVKGRFRKPFNAVEWSGQASLGPVSSGQVG